MPIFFRWIFKINCSIVVLQYIVYTLVVYISLDKPKWKNVNEFDPSSVKNRDLEFPYFLTFAKSADASRNVYICIVNAVTSFCGGNTSESIRFFFQFSKHIAYIYICILSLGPIYHHCLRFPLLYTSLSREKRGNWKKTASVQIPLVQASALQYFWK